MSGMVAAAPRLCHGFGKPGNLDLEASRVLYNSLPDDGDQPEVSDKHIRELADVFVKHNAHKHLGIHLIHGHFALPEQSILLGRDTSAVTGRWSKITKAGEVDVSNIHGHIFMWDGQGFQAYEFQEGPMPDLSSIDATFFVEVIRYLLNHNLTRLLGLQVLVGNISHNMLEFVLPSGTIMVDERDIRDSVPTRSTGWSFIVADGGIKVCQANETHSLMTSGNHKVFNAGKPLPQLETETQLMAALKDVGLLRT
ncbi:Hypothetical protein D9617_56g096210 [Elsinoe fawcettii]|nr:Hypothetical protein D9617_56g096210 [Elsinoe fawcettii]